MWNVDYHRQRGLSRGAAMLLYELLDRQLDNYTPFVDEFEDQVENLGDEIFTSTARDDNRLLNEILTAKTSALRLRRIMLPQREVVNRLARGDYAVDSRPTRESITATSTITLCASATSSKACATSSTARPPRFSVSPATGSTKS